MTPAERVDPARWPVPPMLATAVGEPFDSPAYAFEIKWDGYRAIAFVGAAGAGSVALQSRRLRDITAEFPGLRRISEHVRASRATLDGEIVAMREGRPDFQALQHRECPAVYVVFDILSIDGESLLEAPLADRRRLLEETVVPGDGLALSAVSEGAGVALYESAVSRGLEGIVAKRLDSPYTPGTRSRRWLKVKGRPTADCVIGGVNPGAGRTLGSVAVGVYDGGDLVYIGSVGSGLSDRACEDLLSRLRPATAPPFDFGDRGVPRELRSTRWVVPDTVCEVGFAEVTRDVRLRQPSFIRLRYDRDPGDCVIDQVVLDKVARLPAGEGGGAHAKR